MQAKNIVIKSKVGLHARAAALFVQTASRFLSDIFIKMDDKRVNAKSIMGIMALGASKGDEVEITIKGDDEKEAMDALIELLEVKLPQE
ncbi:HPr family phosphocarrier protein [Sporosalibacterium faouarense]|uniref:HPr family phosphocarrier protein n=1 Tax=Sporosalibacterium faouarense TaxID=516123 RepID=UPI00141CF31E|nr:HPr family phosphocarrier protein [Sporosalibacterium faouarense]MTI47309.1 HPr family phosphocarrier protein [Bacillota bacterium]